MLVRVLVFGLCISGVYQEGGGAARELVHLCETLFSRVRDCERVSALDPVPHSAGAASWEP